MSTAPQQTDMEEPVSSSSPSAVSDRASLGLARGIMRVTRLGLVRALCSTRRWRARRRGAKSFMARSDDGARIEALFLPARPEVPKRLPVILAHGYCETKEYHLRRAMRLNEAGHDVIVFDHRGHGASGGRRITFGVRERHDVRVLIDSAQRHRFVGDRVITFGYSLGGATVLMHAALDHRVAGIVALAPFVDLNKALDSYRRRLAPWAPHHWLIKGFEQACAEAGFRLEDASPLAVIDQIRVPLLLIVGDADRNLSADEHSRVLAQAKVHGECRLMEIPRATHLSLVRRKRPAMDKAIIDFCANLS